MRVEQQGNLQPGDRLLFVQAARGSRVTNALVREVLHVDAQQARLTLKRLAEPKLLVRSGSRGGTAPLTNASVREVHGAAVR